MKRSLVLVTALFICRSAAAGEPAAPVGPSNGNAGNSEPILPDLDILLPRRGFHVGFGVELGIGGTYTPGPEAIVHVDLNYGFLRFDSRVSSMGYYTAESDRPAMGLGLAVQMNLHFNSRFMISTMGFIAVHRVAPSGDSSYTTIAGGEMFSPATIRLGTKRDIELGLQLAYLTDSKDTANTTNSTITCISLSFLLL